MPTSASAELVRAGVADGLYHEVYDDGPDDTRDVVILSSGLGGSGAFWTPQMAALTERFRVVLYDHRGAGRSVRRLGNPHSVDAMADDIVTVMDALGLDAAHVVGHAAGGLAGLSLGLRHPARLKRLAVVNAWSRPDPHIARCFSTRLHLLNDSGPAAYVRAQPLFLYPAGWISDNDARLTAEEAHHIEQFPPLDIMRVRINALLGFDIHDRLGEVSTPVLVSASADDMLVPVHCSHRLAEGLPNATLTIAPWGGHGFTVTAPAAFNARLISFLAGDSAPA